MNNSIQHLSLTSLAIAFIPVMVALVFFYRWSLNVKKASLALVRMLVQLLLIGTVLTYIFNAKSAWLMVFILSVMIFAASWIALSNIKTKRSQLMRYAIGAIALGGGFTLFIITQGVLTLDPWYQPQVLIPLAGMIFAGSMNSVSLSAERFYAERDNGKSYHQARFQGLNAASIPVVNSLLAVGIISLPGMMTGQILSGVSPLIAVRYQIMVMCMIFSASIISAALFLLFLAKEQQSNDID